MNIHIGVPESSEYMPDALELDLQVWMLQNVLQSSRRTAIAFNHLAISAVQLSRS